MNKSKNNHRRAQSNNDIQQILYSKISGIHEHNTQKLMQKNQSYNNVLFLIPEQTDIASSTEQSLQSVKKTLIIDQNNQNNHSQEQKENHKNQAYNSNLISQIEQLIKDNNPTIEITQNQLNNERYDKNKHLSFANELQKKNNQIIQQSHNKTKDYSSLTPDKQKVEINNIKLNSHLQKSDQTEKSKIELSNSLLNCIIKVDSKKKVNAEQQQSYRRLELQMSKIQKDIDTIKIRQDQQDQFNRNIQNQLYNFMDQSKKQQDYGCQSLQKLEQLELITKRNEESIQLIKKQIMKNQSNQFNQGNENIINFGNLTSYKQEIDQYRKNIKGNNNNKL